MSEETEFDFQGARRGPVAPDTEQKTRITTFVDNDVLEALKAKADELSQPGARVGYQTVLNRLLREALGLNQTDDTGPGPGTQVVETKDGRRLFVYSEDLLRSIIRDELSHTQADEEGDEDGHQMAK